MPTSYATTSQLRTRLAVTTTVSDDWLQQLLDAAAVTVDKATRGYRAGYEAFAASSSETRYFDDDLYAGYVAIDDLLTISALTRDGVAVLAADYKLWPYNRGVPAVGPAERIYLSRTGGVSAGASMFYGSPWAHTGAGQYAVTGTWGYCTTANLPPCVVEATLRQAQLWYESSQVGPTQLSQMLVNPYTSLRADIAAILRPVQRCVAVG